jgi:hypothetical protein
MELINDVGIFDHFLSDDECDYFIELFKNKEKNGFVFNRQDSENSPGTIKKDDSMGINLADCTGNDKLDERNKSFIENFWNNAFKEYTDHYSSLIDHGLSYHLYAYKVQKTLPGGGYHVWHYENNSGYVASRVLTWIIYLNDDFEGGETEFLYKNMRVKSKKGTLAIFPCNYTHTHRGNPPLTGEKYIMTSWIHN